MGSEVESQCKRWFKARMSTEIDTHYAALSEFAPASIPGCPSSLAGDRLLFGAPGDHIRRSSHVRLDAPSTRVLFQLMKLGRCHRCLLKAHRYSI